MDTDPTAPAVETWPDSLRLVVMYKTMGAYYSLPPPSHATSCYPGRFALCGTLCG
jgi:hypothetical protein